MVLFFGLNYSLFIFFGNIYYYNDIIIIIMKSNVVIIKKFKIKINFFRCLEIELEFELSKS